MKAINKKLIFGTANLSKPYGINSQKIQNHNSIKNIIEFLKKEKINFVDTAYSYGSAVKDLGKNRIQKFKSYIYLTFNIWNNAFGFYFF